MFGECHKVRDAIVLSGWTWEAWNVPERIALALGHLGSRVLYCENPVSRFRNSGRTFDEMAGRIHGFTPRFLGHRLNHLPLAPYCQARMIVRQIHEGSKAHGLREPVLIYPHGDFMLPIAAEMKRRGFFLVHVCMDYPDPGQEAHVALSNVTLVIPPTAFHELHARFGEKVRLIPQCAGYFFASVSGNGHSAVPHDLDGVPRPRLGYLGPTTRRLNLSMLREVLECNPDWHFVSFEPKPCLPLPNVHALPWRGHRDLPGILAGLDIGFMPYDCSDKKNMHCVPLKIYDYFSIGLPVVSASILNLLDSSGEVYFGDTSDELARAVSSALLEPFDSPKRKSRVEISRRHSIEKFAEALERTLPLRGD
jgi:hypothetical protein